jgi:hypothetical protein
MLKNTTNNIKEDQSKIHIPPPLAAIEASYSFKQEPKVSIKEQNTQLFQSQNYLSLISNVKKVLCEATQHNLNQIIFDEVFDCIKNLFESSRVNKGIFILLTIL